MSYFNVEPTGTAIKKTDMLIKEAFYFGRDEASGRLTQLQAPFYVEGARVSMYISAAKVVEKVPIIDDNTGEVIGEEEVTKVFRVGKYVEVQSMQEIIVNNGLDVYTATFIYDDTGYFSLRFDSLKPYRLDLYCEKISYTDAFNHDRGYLDPENPNNIIDEITELPPDEIIAEQEPNEVVVAPRYVDVPIADMANYDATLDDCEFVQAAEIGIKSQTRPEEDRPSTNGVTRYNNFVIFKNRNFINITGVIRMENITGGQTLNLFKVNLKNGFLKDESLPGFQRTNQEMSTLNNAQLRFFGETLQLRVINDIVTGESVVFNISIPRTSNYTTVDPATGEPVTV